MIPNKLIVYGVAALIILGLGGFLITRYGASQKALGKEECLAAQSAAIVKDTKAHEKNKNELRQITDHDLAVRYCKWVHGIEYNQCVRTINFLK